MLHLDLFSGIGGFALAARRVGWETIAFCEIDPYCQRVLAKHWPGVYIHDDVCTLGYSHEGTEPDDWMLFDEKADHEIVRGSIDVVTGGFPCQDISAAGNSAGITGERSGLWSELCRLIGEVRPRVAVLENVTRLLSGERGRWFQRVLGDLAEVGYDCEWHCVPASYIGAPHRRDRVWIIAYPGGNQLRQQPGRRHGESRPGSPEPGDDGPAESMADARGGNDPNPRRPLLEGWQWARPDNGSELRDYAGWWSAEPAVGFCPDGFPGWLVRHCGIGLSYAESQRAVETLLSVWCDDAAKAVWSEIGGLGRMDATKVLFAFLREYPQESDLRRLLKEGQKALAKRVRIVRERLLPGSTPYRPRPDEQYEVEHPDFVCAMSWQAASWNTFEGGLDRVATGVSRRVDRLRGLGNAIVPQMAELIFRSIQQSEL